MSDETSPATDLPSSVGRYQITGALGIGAMGAVYKAFDPLIKRTLAIKTIRLDIPRQSKQYATFIERFYREARISGTLSHPNIVTLFDIGEEGGSPFLAMEYVEGQTISALLEAGTRFKPEKVIGLVSQVAAALDYAHSRGVVHRDIKPSNLIVFDEDKVKVTDFGIAKLADAEITHAGVLLGTPSYMSPEQAMGEKLDGRSDIFSLGVCAFEMLSGLQPFPGANVTAILYKLVHVDPIEPPDLELNGLVPQKWHDVFHKVLAKRPEERYQTASEFVQDLEYCLGAWFTGIAEQTLRMSPQALTETTLLPPIVPGTPAGAGGDTATVMLQTGALRASDTGARKAPPLPPLASVPPQAGDTATVMLKAGVPAATTASATGARKAPPPLPPARSEADTATVLLKTAALATPVEETVRQAGLDTVARGRTPAIPAAKPSAVPAAAGSGLRWVVAGAGLVFLLAGSVGGIAWWQKQRRVPPPVDTAPTPTTLPALPPPTTLASAAETGSLHVESNPSEARVIVNGEAKGVTPLDLAELPFGSYELRLERKGFEPQSRTIVLSAAAPAAQASVPLTRSAVSTASADVLSEPAGAQVTLDGRPAGRTPLAAAALKPGSHRLDLTLDGYVKWSGVLDVVSGQKGRVEVRLQRLAPVATPTPPPRLVDTARVYRSDEVDVPPRKVSGASPSYPSDRGAPRLRSGQKVSVMVQFVVTETGEIQDLKIVESGGALLDEVVAAAVRTWKFQPAMKLGTRVKAQMTAKQTFLGG